jgi:hypothetical protein
VRNGALELAFSYHAMPRLENATAKSSYDDCPELIARVQAPILSSFYAREVPHCLPSRDRNLDAANPATGKTGLSKVFFVAPFVWFATRVSSRLPPPGLSQAPTHQTHASPGCRSSGGAHASIAQYVDRGGFSREVLRTTLTPLPGCLLIWINDPSRRACRLDGQALTEVKSALKRPQAVIADEADQRLREAGTSHPTTYR